MIELAEDLHLEFEAGALAGPVQGAVADDLDRHVSPRGMLNGVINHALAASVDFTDQFITRKEIWGGRAQVRVLALEGPHTARHGRRLAPGRVDQPALRVVRRRALSAA
jgi:hypothetical protein